MRRYVRARVVVPVVAAVVLAGGGLMLWIATVWPEQLQQTLAGAVVNTPYTLMPASTPPRLRWRMSPVVVLGDIRLQPRIHGDLPQIDLAQAEIRLNWRGGVTGFRATTATIALPQPVRLDNIRLLPLRQQAGFALDAHLGADITAPRLRLEMGPQTEYNRPILVALGSFEAAGQWQTTATGGTLALPRIRMDDTTGHGHLTLTNNRIGGNLALDQLNLSGGGLPDRALIQAMSPYLGAWTLSLGQLELGGIRMRAVTGRIDATHWRLQAGQGPTAITATGTWQMADNRLSLPDFSWHSRHLIATGALTAASASVPVTQLRLEASRLDLTPRTSPQPDSGNAPDSLRLIQWLRGQSTPLEVELSAPAARLPLLPAGRLRATARVDRGLIAIKSIDWQAAGGDVLTLAGTIDVAALFPKLDLTLNGERAIRPDRLGVRLVGPATHPALTATALIARHQVRVDGQFNLLTPQTPFQGSTSLNAPDGTAAKGTLRMTAGVLVADDVTGQISGQDIRGSLRLDPRGPLPQLTANLQVGDVTLPQLGALAALGAGGWARGACIRQMSPLPPFLSQLTLTARRITLAAGTTLDRASLFIEGRPGGAQGRLRTRQGTVDVVIPGAGRGIASGAPSARIQLGLRDIGLTAPMLRQGRLGVSGTLLQPTPCAADWLPTLEGDLRYQVESAVWGGVDLDQLSMTLADKGLGGLLGGGVRTAFGQDARTVLPTLTGTAQIRDNMLTLAPVTWQQPTYKATLGGQVGLGNQALNLNARLVQQTSAGPLPITIGIHGTPDAPRIGLR